MCRPGSFGVKQWRHNHLSLFYKNKSWLSSLDTTVYTGTVWKHVFIVCHVKYMFIFVWKLVCLHYVCVCVCVCVCVVNIAGMPWEVWGKPPGDRQLPHGETHISFGNRRGVEVECCSDTPRSSWHVNVFQTSSPSWVQCCATRTHTHTHTHTLTHYLTVTSLRRWNVSTQAGPHARVWFKPHASPDVYSSYNSETFTHI